MTVTQNFLKNYPPPLWKEVLGLPIQVLRLRATDWRTPQFQKIRFGKHPRQYFLFTPPAPDAPLRRTVGLFYHGGGWRTGWPGMFPAVTNFFTRRGFAFVMPGYRLTPRFSFPDMRGDLDQALLVLTDFLKKNGFENFRLLAGGMSAGANLAAHLVFDRPRLEKLGFDQSIFAGFLSCGGPLDLEKMTDTFPLRDFAGGSHGSAAFAHANPVHHLYGSAPLPAFFIHGTSDWIVPHASAKSFFEKYRSVGPAEWVELPGKNHIDSLNWAGPDRETAQRLEAWLEQFD